MPQTSEVVTVVDYSVSDYLLIVMSGYLLFLN